MYNKPPPNSCLKPQLLFLRILWIVMWRVLLLVLTGNHMIILIWWLDWGWRPKMSSLGLLAAGAPWLSSTWSLISHLVWRHGGLGVLGERKMKAVGFWRLSSWSLMVLFLLHSAGHSRSQGQPRFKQRKKGKATAQKAFEVGGFVTIPANSIPQGTEKWNGDEVEKMIYAEGCSEW